MSLVRTTEQARGLQACSVSPCVVCGRGARLLYVAFTDEWAETADGTRSVLGRISPVSYHHRVCARHKHFTGVVAQQRGYGQVVRFHVLASGAST